jgi:hypothetical protein
MTNPRRHLPTIAGLVVFVGCTGVITSPKHDLGAGAGGGGGSAGSGPGAAGVGAGPPLPGQSAPLVFSCDASAQPDELPLARLSRVQLGNTLRFAIRLALPAEADAIWAKASPAFDRYPVDQRTPAPGDLKGGYSRFDQSIQQTQIDAMYATGIAIAQELTASSARLASMMGSCATDASSANDRTCLESFLGNWAGRVMREKLSAEDVATYADIAGSTPVNPAAVADVIATVLNAPQTLYRVEHGTEDKNTVSTLSPFELAARLSYLFWQEPPDDVLWAAANDGSLLAPLRYDAELDRILTSPLLRRAVDEMVTEWLRLQELPPLDTLKTDPIFAAFAGAQSPPASARDGMIADVLGSFWSVLSSGATASAFLNDRHSYATDSYVAGIYQVPPWQSGAPAPMFASPKRSGLLTRAALLATGTAGTRPIHKGYLVRNTLLCQQVGAPPVDANTKPPIATGQTTTRQAVTERTSSGVCGACHTGIINPPGFITEGFDALGRERTEEKLFDAQGGVVASLPIDTSAVPAVQPGDDRSMSDASALTAAIDASRLFHSCFARQTFRFAESRVENLAQDGCLLAKLEAAARSDAPLVDVLKVVAQDPTFKTKRFP